MQRSFARVCLHIVVMLFFVFCFGVREGNNHLFLLRQCASVKADSLSVHHSINLVHINIRQVNNILGGLFQFELEVHLNHLMHIN